MEVMAEVQPEVAEPTTSYAVRDQRVHGVDAFGGVSLIVLGLHGQLVCAVAEGHAAGGVDLLNGQLHAVFNVGAVNSHAAGEGADHAQRNGAVAGGGAAVSIACAAFGLAAAGSQAEGQTARQHQG